MQILKTKFNEQIERTSDPKKMLNKFISEKLVRIWKEDFIDEDSGETISIERKEIVLEKGVELTLDQISQVSFFLQSGDIKEVVVSNQKRTGIEVFGVTTVWVASVKIGKKKRNFYLYAYSLQLAIDIIVDYLEQTIEDQFQLTGIKEKDFINLIPVNDETTYEDFYELVIEISRKDSISYEQSFVVQAQDAEKGKDSVILFLKTREEDEEIGPFETTIVSAKKIPISNIVDYQFSKEYFQNK